ncbi:MAG: substrate-binding domain-containing protein [Staphylococcus equorum]|nr:substrate-binding domain-containing protein [Staphylococcus equorum]
MKKRMKKFLSIALAMVLAVFMVACSTEAPGSDEEAVDGTDEDITIGFSVSTLNNPYFVTLADGVEEAGEEAGADVVVVDAQDDPGKQVSDIEDLIQQGVDILLINPSDEAGLGAGVEAANAEDIPVITLERDIDSGEIESYIASDGIQGGELAGEYIVEELENTGNVVEIQGITGVISTRERGEGFHNIVDEEENIEVVASQSASFDRTEGLTVMENIIQGNPEIEAVFAHNDEMALGAVEAVEAQGLEDVLIVGFDATDDAVEAVEEGRMAATVEQQPSLMAEVAVDAAIDFLNGEEIDDFIPVDVQLITE